MDTRLLNALRAVSTATTAFLDVKGAPDVLLHSVARAVTEAVPDLCVISLVTGDHLTVMTMHDDSAVVRAAYEPLLKRRRPISAMAASALEQTLFTPAVDLETLTKALPPDSADIMRNIGVRGMIVVPLRSRGKLLGLMSVLRHRPERPPLDDTDRAIAEVLADHAALCLGTAALAMEQESLVKELERSKFLDVLIESLPDMVFVKEAENLTFVRFNRAGEELLGIPRGELMGKGDRDFFPPQEADFFIAKDRETLARGTVIDIPEEPIKTAHGDRWLHTKKVPIVDDQGTPRYLLGISEDITERKRALADLAAARDKAEAANRELESFSYSVAHDLRAPLRAIDGFAQALLEDYGKNLDSIGQRHLDRIRAAAQRMAMLIDDLLRLSRVTRHEQKREVVNLSALARLAVAQIERVDPDRRVDITIEDNLHALADPKLLSIVFDNLFDNAWKFTSKSDRPRIELGSTRDGGETIYFVRDNGAGFDMAYQNKLFGTFSRLHPAHEFPGTGIGLATVKRIIDRHGGRVWAEGKVGKGATFFFTLGDAS